MEAKKAIRRNLFHWIALVLATLTLVGFIAGNYRGIFAWEGIGVYSIPFFGLGALLAMASWFVGQLMSHCKDSLIFFGILLVPVMFMFLLPLKFYV